MVGLEVAGRLAEFADEAAAHLRKQFGRRLDPVEFEFSLLSKAAVTSFEVRGLRFTESLSTPYELDLVLETEELAVETNALLGADSRMLIARDLEQRVVFGIIDRVELLESEHDRAFVRVRIVPAFKQLQYEMDTRIFQGATVPEILAEVLRKSLAPFQRSFDDSRLRGKYQWGRECAWRRRTCADRQAHRCASFRCPRSRRRSERKDRRLRPFEGRRPRRWATGRCFRSKRKAPASCSNCCHGSAWFGDVGGRHRVKIEITASGQSSSSPLHDRMFSQ